MSVFCQVPSVLLAKNDLRLTSHPMRRTFAAIDEDDSGVIERKEFRRLMKRLAPQMGKDEVDTCFDEIDTDGGG